jgi:hypothetical protein
VRAAQPVRPSTDQPLSSGSAAVHSLTLASLAHIRVKEVTDRADRMPLSFVRLHAHRKVKGHEIPEGQISSGSAGGHDGDQYSDGGAGPASDHASRSHPSPPPLHLRSMEHVSSALQRRLERGQGTDDAQMLQALNQSQGILLGKASDALIQKGIKPLMVMSESRYTEIQRDSASALHSLAINKENKVGIAACH